MLVYPEVCVISKEVFMATETVGRGASGSRWLRRWGEGRRGPVARPRASSLPVIIRGAAPEILTRHSSGEYSLCVAYSSMCVVLVFFIGSH